MSQVDDAFKAYADDVSAEEASRRNPTPGAGYTPLKWTGLEKNVVKVVRALGGVPNSDDSPFTSRTVRIAHILNDKGKRMRVILPAADSAAANTNILWKIINRVMDVDWVDKKKYYVQEKKNPEIFNIVAYNALDENDNKRKYGLEGRGWSGRDFFIMNCIDRTPAMYKWHQENKKTALLSKTINVAPNKKGEITEYPEEGVPAYGFVNTLANTIFKYYGDWRDYDIGIEKTGQMNTPFRIINANKHIEEIPANLQKLVVTGPLSEEEKTWEAYDLRKLFAPSSATKIYNGLKVTIRQIDDILGTNYLSELKYLADEEAKVRAANKVAEEPEDDEEAPPLAPAVVEEAPAREVKRETAPVRSTVLSSKESLPAYDKLTDDEKNLIKSATKEANGSWTLEYNTTSQKYKCPSCQTISPAEFKTCPVCSFSFD